jgi:hypothetical protein
LGGGEIQKDIYSVSLALNVIYNRHAEFSWSLLSILTLCCAAATLAPCR